MSKRKKVQDVQNDVNWQLVNRLTKDMKLKDLQRACIARGMPFDEMAGSTVFQLHSWFSKNYDRGQDVSLLNDYDLWVEQELLAVNPEYTHDHPINHPTLRLGYFGEVMDNGEKKKKKLRLKGVDKPKKKKKERLEGTKVIKGTKKALTYQLTIQGLSLDDIIEKVEAEFEEVNTSSISNWHKRCLKEMKNA